MKMMISKSHGEKLTDKDLKGIYGGACGTNCGECDCTSSGGEKFFGTFDAELTAWERNFLV